MLFHIMKQTNSIHLSIVNVFRAISDEVHVDNNLNGYDIREHFNVKTQHRNT